MALTGEYCELMGKSVQRGDSGIYLELNSLLVEYKNLFDRSNKLDNKVYITITFCGFLFVFITGIFSGIAEVGRTVGLFGTMLTVLYVLSCIAVVVTYVGVLIYFLNLLKPEGIRRMDPELLEGAKLETVLEAEAAARLVALYRKNIDADLEMLHARCDKFTRGVRYVVANVILAFVAYALQIAVTMVR